MTRNIEEKMRPFWILESLKGDASGAGMECGGGGVLRRGFGEKLRSWDSR